MIHQSAFTVCLLSSLLVLAHSGCTPPASQDGLKSGEAPIRAAPRADDTVLPRHRAVQPRPRAYLASPFDPMPASPSGALAGTDAPLVYAGLVVSQYEAEDIDRQHRGAVLWFNVDCCEFEALDSSVGIALGLMAAADLPADAPLFIEGGYPALTARLVDLLRAEGLTRVYLIAN